MVTTQFKAALLHQIYSNREVEEALTKIRDVLSDDKRDWELRVAAVRHPHLSFTPPFLFFFFKPPATFSYKQLKKLRSLLLAGAAEFDGFLQQLRLMEAAFKLSAKDLRSQVVREACITLGWVSEGQKNEAHVSVLPKLSELYRKLELCKPDVQTKKTLEFVKKKKKSLLNKKHVILNFS